MWIKNALYVIQVTGLLGSLAAMLYFIGQRNFEYSWYFAGSLFFFYVMGMMTVGGSDGTNTRYVDRWDVGREDETDIDLP